MIIIDLSQILFASLGQQMNGQANAVVDESFLRHLVLNSIRSYKVKFGLEYGEIVIAVDSSSWRKREFKYYKANRKKSRDAATHIDWAAVFTAFENIRNELKEYFPYRVIQVEGAEGDDIIGVLCHEFGDDGPLSLREKIMIISSDGDFKQLQKFSNVRQFNPVLKKQIICKSPELYLREHIVRGDAGDGVPNILSADDTFVVGKRQVVLSEKRFDRLMDPATELSVDERRNWYRNQTLVDLSKVPREICELILKEYEAQAGKGRTKMFNYFMKHQLKNLLSSLSEF